jgi:hypothetical protein
MNLFKEYYESLIKQCKMINEMATTFIRAPKGGITIKGVNGKKIKITGSTREGSGILPKTYPDVLNYLKNFNFSKIKNSLKKGKEELGFDSGANGIVKHLIYIIKSLPDDILGLEEKKQYLEKIIDATNTPYHQFQQLSQYKIDDFKRINTEIVDDDVEEGKLDEELAENIKSNLKSWNNMIYKDIAIELERIDAISRGETDLEDKEQLLKNNPRYKARSISALTGTVHKTGKNIVEDDQRDKTLIFYYAYNKNTGEVEPAKTRLTMLVTHPLYFDYDKNLKSDKAVKQWRMQNIPVKTPFQKGSRSMTYPYFVDVDTGKKITLEDLSKISSNERENIIKNYEMRTISRIRKAGNNTEFPQPSPEQMSQIKQGIDENGNTVYKTTDEIRNILNHRQAKIDFMKKYPMDVLQQIDDIKKTRFVKYIYSLGKDQDVVSTVSSLPSTKPTAKVSSTIIDSPKPTTKSSSYEKDEDDDERYF